MSFQTITLEISDNVATVTLNRPQSLNAIVPEMSDELLKVLDQITAPESTVRCLLITGAGRGFCSGADLAAAGGIQVGDGPIDAGKILELHYNPLLERLMELPMPLVTAVNGVAAGAGCSLALVGDIAIAGSSALFLQAFVNIGLVPDVGSTWLLPRLVGKARAQAMMMLGEKIPAQTALEWGMIYKVVEDAELQATALDIAKKLAQGPTVAHTLIRTGVRRGLEMSLTESLQLERVNQKKAGQTADFAEGVAAFLAKRPAQFSGR